MRRALTTLLRLALPPDRREEVLGDLEERYVARAAERGAVVSAVWYSRQAITLALWGLAVRLETLRPFGAGSVLAQDVIGDARSAARSLLSNPGYTAIAVATLGLGIGGNTAVFSVVNGVVLQPLPFPQAGELVAIHETRVGQSWWSAAPVNAVAWAARSRTLDGVAWATSSRMSLTTSEPEPQPIGAAAVSANMFEVLEVEAHLGRTFVAGDDARGAPPIAALTYDAWRTRFGADPGVIGRRLELDGVPHTVVGVLPDGGEPAFMGAHEVVVPRMITELEMTSRGRILQSIGRIADGVSLEAARAEMAELGARLDDEAPAGTVRGWGVRLVPLKEQVVGPAQNTLLVLLGAVGLVLLVACANLSNLMLARGSARANELAVRASLGAGRGRLVRHLLLESLLVSVAGGTTGLVLAIWGTDALLAIDPSAVPRLATVEADAVMFAFTGAISVVAALAFGLVPALRATRLELSSLVQGGARLAGSRADSRLRATLVAAEVALVVVLLVGSGMLLRSIQALAAVDPGFRAEDRIAVRFTPPASRYPDAAAIQRLVFELSDRVPQLPGVTAAGMVSTLPLSGGPGYTSLQVVRSHPEPEPGGEPIGGMEIVTPGYFDAMGIPVLAGRDFERADAEGRPIIVVDDAMVDRFWSTGDPLTDAVRIAPPNAGPAASWRDVVGVVGSVHYGLDSDRRPRMYLLEGHIPFTLRPRTLVVHVETGSQDAVIAAVRDLFREVDPLLSIERVERLEDVARSSIARSRFQTTLLTVFAAIALALGAVGVYGVVSYTVARRTRDVGVRLALGASRSGVIARVLRNGLVPVAVGLVVGLLGAAASSRVVSSVAYGVEPLDPVAFAIAPALLVPVALLAAFLPARRATRIDPVRALREE